MLLVAYFGWSGQGTRTQDAAYSGLYWVSDSVGDGRYSFVS